MTCEGLESVFAIRPYPYTPIPYTPQAAKPLHSVAPVSDSETQGGQGEREGEGAGRKGHIRDQVGDEVAETRSGVGEREGTRLGRGGGADGGGRERKEAERDDRHDMSRAQVSALVRDCLKV